MSVSDPVAGTPGQIDATNSYGATVATVNAFLPHRTISATSEPNLTQVQQYIAMVTAEVSLTIGDLDQQGWSADFLSSVGNLAGQVVSIGAAAWAEDAAFPERTDPENKTSWGAVLWDRYNTMRTALAETVSRGPAIPAAGPLYPDLGCAWNKPLSPLIADVGGPLAQEYSDFLGYPIIGEDQLTADITAGEGADWENPVTGPPQAYDEVG